MRNRFFLFAFALLFSSSMFSTVINDEANTNDAGDGQGGRPDRPHIAGNTTMVNGTNIETTLPQTSGNVNVIIRDEYGLIYNRQSIDTSQQNRVRIDTSRLPAGNYQIEYIDLNNNLINRGKFEVK